MSRAQLTSTVEQNTGGAVAPFVAGKNKIINGDFGVAQRGTSISVGSSSYTYTLDRFKVFSANTSTTVSQSTSAPTGFTYSCNLQRPNGNAGTNSLNLVQIIESANVASLQGQQIVVSFYIKKGANYSGGNIGIQLLTGTGTDQGGDPYSFTGLSTAINDSSYSPTTSFVRVNYGGTISSSVKELALVINYTPTGTAGADDAIYVTGIQLEAGSVATPFTTAGGTLSGELAACKRYFQKTYGANEAIGTPSTGSVIWTQIEGSETSRVLIIHQFPVEMRTSPTVTGYGAVSGSSGVWYSRSANADRTITSIGTYPNGIAYNTISGTNSAGQQVLVCYTASAEL